MKSKVLEKIYRGMVYVLPAVLFFSYHPVISISRGESMNFELSLALIFLVIFDIVSAVLLVQKHRLGGILKNWKWLLLPVFLSLSVLWSANPSRGILTAGILWMVYFAIYAMFSLKDLVKSETSKEMFFKFFFGSALVVAAWCFLQCVLDLVGVPREVSLMCAGCTYQSFGFPHPNGFAVEPQFMGNLLLAPAIMSMWFLSKDEGNSTSQGRVARARRHGARALILGRNLRKPLEILLPFIFIATLFLTFSRGAIYAFGVAMVFVTAYLWVKERKLMKKIMMAWGVAIAAFLFTLNAQGIMAQVSPTNDTYWSGVSKVLNHLSLGIIDVKKASAAEEAMFDGYVAESTETRVKLTDVALKSWSKNWQRILFGVGLGGAGVVMYNDGLMDWPKEIVQNEYASLLLETGLVGIFLVIFTLGMVILAVRKTANAGALLALIVAYLVTLCFFSGLPNALHIYLMPAVLMIFFGQSSLRKKLVS